MLDNYVDADPTGALPPAAEPAARSRLAGFERWLAPESPLLVYAGVAVVAVGFVLIAIAWSEIAALTNVALQMPYLVSAGITGLALVMVGLLLINVGTKRRDGAARERQTAAIADAMIQLRLTVEQIKERG